MTLDRVTAVLFDIGGTCLEIDHAFLGGRIRARGVSTPGDWVARGERAGRGELESRIRAGRPGDEQWRGFFESFLGAVGVAAVDVAPIFDEVVDFHARHHLWRVVMPGLPETLRALAARGYRVAAISNADGRVESVLGRLGLAQEFEFVLDSHEVGFEKPDPRIFAAGAERLGLPPGRCAYVGDVVAIDVHGARAAGLHPVLFDAYGAYDAASADGAPRVAEPAQLLGLFPDRRDELVRRRRAG